MTIDTGPVRTAPWSFGLWSSDSMGDREREYVLRVLEKKRLFRYMDEGGDESEARRVEDLYSKRLGATHCLAVNSGTSALIAALVGAGIGPGDEVIVPAYTYIATVSAVLIARAVPVIVEVDDTLTMDPRSLRNAITPYTRAVMPVHMRGVPCQMDELMQIAADHHLIVIEDVAQANGGSYKGRPLGTFGAAGCFSFQQLKLVTSGEGGLVATNDDPLYERAAVYHDSAFVYWDLNKKFDFELFPGENYRMSELHAAVALAQSERLDSIVDRLQIVKRTVVDGIDDLAAIQLQRVPDPAGDVSYSLVFYLSDERQAEKFAAQLTEEGIPSGTANGIGKNGFPDRHIYRNWDHLMEKRGVTPNDNPWDPSIYKGSVEYSRDMCPRTLDWLGRGVSLFLHHEMTSEDCDDIVQAIRKVAARF